MYSLSRYNIKSDSNFELNKKNNNKKKTLQSAGALDWRLTGWQ